MTDAAVVDDSGSTHIASRGTRVYVTSSILLGDGVQTLSVRYVVQVKDLSDQVVFLSSKILALKEGFETTIEMPWVPLRSGEYTIQTLAWQDIDSPPSFAHSRTTLSVQNSEPPCSGSAACFEGIVSKVIDGDTIDVDGITLRFALVDSPERGEQGYTEATAFTSERCPEGSWVIVDEDDGQTLGSYGRTIAKIYCEGGIINEELLKSQNAVILGQYCDESEFGREQWAITFGC
jgi:endonuclease YncB( thermonuclease family)